MRASKRPLIGFKPAFEYLLDVLCFGYYVKSDNLVSDQTFDELEKLYCKMFDEKYAPKRACERGELYSRGVEIVYEMIRSKDGPIN